ncbi:MAG: 30S ribosomal protein S16 [Deltaproteobacteria bacterium]|nr:MAG: 30S ribosomal protein S16 [Deltaproteobacteria bacterium]
MAVSIRLRRAGRRNRPFYHIVATDSRNPRDGAFLEKLGYYDPTARPAQFKLDLERYNDWIKKGARASDTVASLAAKLEEQATDAAGQQGD